jgi:hypothetical protein
MFNSGNCLLGEAGVTLIAKTRERIPAARFHARPGEHAEPHRPVTTRLGHAPPLIA